MIHRTDMVSLGVEDSDERILQAIRESGLSRFPVYGEDADDILGILSTRDYFLNAREPKPMPLRQLLRPAYFIPESVRADLLFRDMQSKAIHMAIVVDEYGGTSGLVTMEDLLEEIVGNILDEYDKEEELIVKREDGSYLFDGLTPLGDVAEALEIEFSEEDRDNYDTLNGFLISRLDRIPKEDEQPEAAYGGYLFKAVSVENKMLHRVIAVLDKKEQEEENGEAAGQ